MVRPLPRYRHALLTVAVLALQATVLADAPQDKFQRAFFLEQHARDLPAAEKLYAEVAADASAPADLRAEAKSRRDGCREELACSDFARLMPASAWAYAELSNPGEQILSLLEQLGLLRGGVDAAASQTAQQIAISPELVRELLGIRGVAAAVTGVNPATQMPAGVAILHPGRLAVLRAVLETALPISFRPAEPIEGCTTFHIEGQVYLTLTARLIIASPQRELIEGVIDRLRGDTDDSLAASPEMADAIKARGDGLLYFCVNFKPILPLIHAAMAAGASQSQEVAMAATVLDPRSLRMLSGRAGFGDDGFRFDLDLTLDQGHRNLAFHFLRLPAVDADSLRRVPAGAAGFLTFALSDAGSRYPSMPAPDDSSAAGPETVPVSFLDIGRELFANIIGVAAFALPSSESASTKGPPMPDAAVVFTVNDPARSQALWGLFLGLAGMAGGGGTIDGTLIDIDGAQARRYTLPEGITVYFATAGNAVIISPSRQAVSRAVAAQRGGTSIVDDPAFSTTLARLTSDTTVAIAAHPGRCIELARSYMDDDDLLEIQPFAETMKETVVALMLRHGDRSLGATFSITGIPKLGPVLSRLVREELQRDRDRASLSRRMHRAALQESLRASERRLAPDAAAPIDDTAP